jgi:hypothetical protein
VNTPSPWDGFFSDPRFSDEPGPSRHGWKAAAPAQENQTLLTRLFFLRGRIWWHHISNGRYEEAQAEAERITRMMDVCKRFNLNDPLALALFMIARCDQ